MTHVAPIAGINCGMQLECEHVVHAIAEARKGNPASDECEHVC